MTPTDFRPSASVNVRSAVLADLHGMARVHVNGWKTTYRGMVPDELLDRLTGEGDIARGFGSGLKERRPGAEQFVALTPPEEIVGYAHACPNREPDSDFTGELEAIYVLKSYQGRGVGTVLVREVARHLVNTGKTSMIAWVLPQNPYRRFYERLGGALVGKRVSQPHRLGVGPMPEVGYGWKDIRGLADL
ncbi:MAG TPA: GNAT family N-acetyltransferase [Thermoplasmata archaeon]|jgi:GNAT superfamily N-acetyltransferase